MYFIQAYPPPPINSPTTSPTAKVSGASQITNPNNLFALPFCLLIVCESAPALTELLSDLAEGQVGILLNDFGTGILGEEHVIRKLLLATLYYLCINDTRERELSTV